MKNANLEQATAELREALVNFLNMGRTCAGYDRTRAEEAYNDMQTWFNFFVQHNDLQTEKLAPAEVHDGDDERIFNHGEYKI